MLSMKQAASRPEAAVAERGVGLELLDPSKSTPSSRERRAAGLGEAEVADGVGQQPADQELEREIVDALLAVS